MAAVPPSPEDGRRPAVLADWDSPLDLDKRFAQRHGEAGGRGNLGQPRENFATLSRAALDMLLLAVDAGFLTPMSCLVVLSLATRAGYSPAAPGLVLGTVADLSRAVPAHRETIGKAIDHAEGLELLERVHGKAGKGVGVRFPGTAYLWLTGQPGGTAPARLASVVAPLPD